MTSWEHNTTLLLDTTELFKVPTCRHACSRQKHMLLPSYRDLLAAPDARGCASAATFVAREIKRVGAFLSRWRAWPDSCLSHSLLRVSLTSMLNMCYTAVFLKFLGLTCYLLSCRWAPFF